MTIYLKLMHGRDDPDQQMDDWGFDGPVLGPFEAMHFTYATHVRCFPKGSDGDAEALELCYRDDMLVHDGKYYGDFEIASSFGSAIPYKTDKATERPWYLDDDCVRIREEGTEVIVATAAYSPGLIELDETFANAKLIVLAVNAHDKLKSACQWLVQAYEEGNAESYAAYLAEANSVAVRHLRSLPKRIPFPSQMGTEPRL